MTRGHRGAIRPNDEQKGVSVGLGASSRRPAADEGASRRPGGIVSFKIAHHMHGRNDGAPIFAAQ